MDLENKKNVLRQLAKKGNEIALNALEKEIDKISFVLSSSSNYEELSTGLDLLDEFAYRVHFKAISAIKSFLLRQGELTLSYEEIPAYPPEELAKYQNNNTLIVQALKVLEHIRYHEPEGILDIFFQYCTHENEKVSKQAIHGLTEFVKFHLDIFYGDGESWSGLGPQPQEQAIEKIISFDEKDKRKFFAIIKSLCKEMLSPEITGTTWTYKTATFNRASISPTNEVKMVRRKALGVLKDIYPLANTPNTKKSILRAMYEATRTPNQISYSDEVLPMVLGDTAFVLSFIKDIVANENLEVVQSIEHDVYNLFRRGRSDDVKSLVFEIKESIDKNGEYKIFKVLIGFEGIFSNWETEGGRDFHNETKLREAKAKEFAESITKENFTEWRVRILSYAEIDSNDLATFPQFGKFLQTFSKNSPSLAIELISEESEKIKRFLVPILLGLWESSGKERAHKIISDWIEEKSYLFSLAKFFSFVEDFDEGLLKEVFLAAKAKSDLITFTQVISAASAQFKVGNKSIVQNLFLPAIEELTNHNNTSWVHEFWFRTERHEIFAEMNALGYGIVLNNLLLADEISYEHEEVLAGIAKNAPESVIQFFCDRISKKQNGDTEGKYDSIPFSFQSSLSEPLSQIPEAAVDIVFNQYDENYLTHIYSSGRLLKNIFVGFPSDFSKKLIELVCKNTNNTTFFVLGVLRNYDGDSRIQEVCKELVKILPDESSLLNETIIALQSTGVVRGEYGLVEAYKKKIEEIKPWLDEPNERVKHFAKNYISILEKRIEEEKKRVDESIVLDKHQYGTNEES